MILCYKRSHIPEVANEDFRRANRRHVYNVNDYLFVGGRYAQLAQCFCHTYRQKRYAFLITNMIVPLWERDIKEADAIAHEDDDDDDDGMRQVLDPVLDLPMHRFVGTQRIYGLPALFHDTVYMIDAPSELDWPEKIGCVMECTWGVVYL